MLVVAPGLSLSGAVWEMATMDTVLRAVRIGAFSGLAVSVYSMISGSHWLLEPIIDSRKEEQSKRRLLYVDLVFRIGKFEFSGIKAEI